MTKKILKNNFSGLEIGSTLCYESIRKHKVDNYKVLLFLSFSLFALAVLVGI
jgi:hypothetical protein